MFLKERMVEDAPCKILLAVKTTVNGDQCYDNLYFNFNFNQLP